MLEDHKRARIETEAIVVGYAMSRLDRLYLTMRSAKTWEQAFREVADALSIPVLSIKNLRDEFDPVHANPRHGWFQRPLRPNRQKVLDELKDVSDEALAELVSSILRRDEEATIEAIDALAYVNRVAYNVAERLLTGRRAEEYFLGHCHNLIQVDPSSILDLRQAACGYDFGVNDLPQLAVEVKGIKEISGSILFTDREWSVARSRGMDYWVVIVGNLAAEPIARVIRDPHSLLPARSVYRQTIAVEWHASVSVRSLDNTRL